MGIPPQAPPPTAFGKHGRMLANFGTPSGFIGEISHLPVYPAGSSFAPMDDLVGKARDFYNSSVVSNLRQQYNVQVVRALMPSLPWIVEFYDLEFRRVQTVIEAAVAERIYVVVARVAAAADSADLEEAKRFYGRIAQRYGSFANVIYEVGTGLPTQNVEARSYAQTVVEEIRRYDAHNLILWNSSFDLGYEAPSLPPLTDTNWAYACSYIPNLHASSKFFVPSTALTVPVFVTEWDYEAGSQGSFEKWMGTNSIPNCSRAVANAGASGYPIGYFYNSNTNFSGPWFDTILTNSGGYMVTLTQRWLGNEQGPAFMYTAPVVVEAERVARSASTVWVTDDVGGGAHVLGGQCNLALFVPNPGSYKVSYRVKSISGTNQIHLSYGYKAYPLPPCSYRQTLGVIREPISGAWADWQDVAHTVQLPGRCWLYINYDAPSAGLALNRFEIKPSSPVQPPRISSISEQYMVMGSKLPGLHFSVSDESTPAADLVVTATSNNPTLLPPSGITVDLGSEDERMVTLNPAAGQSGQTTITLTATDADGAKSTTTFLLTVMAQSPRVDENGDGISDIWAARYGMVGAPDDDNDGDGQTNRQEAEAGTDPNRPESVLTAALERVEDGSLWLSVEPYTPGKYYRLETSPDLITWGVIEPLNGLMSMAQPTSPGGTTLKVQVTSAGASVPDRQYWRVSVQDYSRQGTTVSEWEKRQSDLLVTIAATAGAKGKISPSGTLATVAGRTLTYRMTPDAGYLVEDVIVDGSSVGARTEYTFSKVAAGEHSIRVTFKALEPTNLALNKPVTVSSTESTDTRYQASNAVDGNPQTRWSSAFSEPQWIMIDLGSLSTISKVDLDWEAAYAREYTVQVSVDGASWTPFASTTNGDGGNDSWSGSSTGRYVRVYCTRRGTSWGVSLFEIRVWGIPATPVEPAVVDLSQTQYFPPYLNQGGLGTCDWFAIAYGQMTYTLNRLHNRAATNATTFSPQWGYNMVCNAQSYPSNIWFVDIYNFLQRHGSVFLSDLPYDQNYTTWPNKPELWQKATSYRIGGYESVQVEKNRIRQLLRDGEVLVVQFIPPGGDIVSVKDNPATTLDNAFVGERVIRSGNAGYDHTVALVGYNDHIWCDVNNDGVVQAEELGAFKLRESISDYGVNQGSYRWVSYNAVKDPNRPFFAENKAWRITMRKDYRPSVIVRVEVDCPRRDRLHLQVGRSGTTDPTQARLVPDMNKWEPYAMGFSKNDAGLGYNVGASGSSLVATPVAYPFVGSFAYDVTDLLAADMYSPYWFVRVRNDDAQPLRILSVQVLYVQMGITLTAQALPGPFSTGETTVFVPDISHF
jgi:hypothetical protein